MQLFKKALWNCMQQDCQSTNCSTLYADLQRAPCVLGDSSQWVWINDSPSTTMDQAECQPGNASKALVCMLSVSECAHAWWCHDMEMFSALLALCEGNPLGGSWEMPARHWSACVRLHTHDDVLTWKCFLHYWPFVRGIHWVLAGKCQQGTGLHAECEWAHTRMMMSWRGNAFCIISPLWGESTEC